VSSSQTVLLISVRLVECSHIKTSRNAFAESWILIYIHCKPEQKLEALTNVKRCLVTHLVRPKLILMFDANLVWAKTHNVPNYVCVFSQAMTNILSIGMVENAGWCL
jgi:hypothetical protein